MSPDNVQTVLTVFDVLAVLPILWLAFYAACAIFSGGARVTAGRGGGLLFTLCVLWLAVRYASVVVGLGWVA